LRKSPVRHPSSPPVPYSNSSSPPETSTRVPAERGTATLCSTTTTIRPVRSSRDFARRWQRDHARDHARQLLQPPPSTFDTQASYPARSPCLLPSTHRPRGMKPRCPILGWNLRGLEQRQYP
jgi:hypothetical protein